jgi:hypothetical protein
MLMTTMAVQTSQVTAQAPEGRVRMVPAISSIAGEEGPFTVFIVLEDLEHYGALQYDDDRDTVPDREVESIGLGAFEFTIEYDPAVLAVEEVEPGPGLDLAGRRFQCLSPAEEPDSVRFGCISSGSEPPGPQGTVTLASVTLRPVGAGSSLLLLEAELAGPLADDVPVEVIGGAVRVTGRPVATATPTAPAGVSAATPPAGAATVAPAGPTALERDETAEAPTATVAPADTATPAATEDGEEPTEVTVPGQDLEGEDSRSEGDGRSGTSVALWTVVALASVAAAGALGLTAFRWQRRRRRPGA